MMGRDPLVGLIMMGIESETFPRSAGKSGIVFLVIGNRRTTLTKGWVVIAYFSLSRIKFAVHWRVASMEGSVPFFLFLAVVGRVMR